MSMINGIRYGKIMTAPTGFDRIQLDIARFVL